MTPCWSTESLRAKRTGGRGDAIEAKAGGERYSSRGLLLLRLRTGRPIPIVILGLVLGAEKGSDINVSRALAPAGCAGRAGVAAVIFGGSGWALQNSSISLAAVGIVEIPSKIANALPVSSRTPAGSVACASISFFFSFIPSPPASRRSVRRLHGPRRRSF